MAHFSNHPHIEMLDPADLKVSPTHPRRHSQKQIEQIARMVDKVGFIVPIIADNDNVMPAESPGGRRRSSASSNWYRSSASSS